MIFAGVVLASPTMVVVLCGMRSVESVCAKGFRVVRPGREHGDVLKHFRGSAPLAIIIMGVCGCGKTTVGEALARAIDSPFLEGDAFHSPEAVEKMRRAIALTDEDRWPWLDRLGRAMHGELRHGGVAVAACSALKRSYRDRLRETIAKPVLFVLLEGDPEELLRRLTVRRDHYMPASLLDSQFEILERPDADERAITLDAGLPASVLCNELLDWLAASPESRAG